MESWNKLDIVGKKIKEIRISEDVVDIVTKNNLYRICHVQDCCEFVRIISFEGILNMVGNTILDYSEEVKDRELDEYVQSSTLTIYKFHCSDGTYVIEWLGESNGYYSEVPEFKKIK